MRIMGSQKIGKLVIGGRGRCLRIRSVSLPYLIRGLDHELPTAGMLVTWQSDLPQPD